MSQGRAEEQHQFVKRSSITEISEIEEAGFQELLDTKEKSGSTPEDLNSDEEREPWKS